MEDNESKGIPIPPKENPTNPGADVGIEVSNEEFIAGLFPKLPGGAVVAVCSKPGDPTQGGWYPMRADKAIERLLPSHNNYVNGASINPLADGTVSVKKEQAAAVHFLMLDDVGTKVDRNKLGGLLPTYEIETSPGNSQMVFVFETPLISQKLFKAMQDAAFAQGLSDPGANGVTRWTRMPNSVNGKEKHRGTDGKSPRCKVKQWNPTVRYKVGAIVEAFKLKLAPPDDLPTASIVGGASVTTESGDKHGHKKLTTAQLQALLKLFDANMGREKWIIVLMAVWHETGGSAEGFDLIDKWSSAGKTYPGTAALMVQWKSFRPIEKPYTAGTLIAMAKEAGADVAVILQMADAFPRCETVVVKSVTAKPIAAIPTMFKPLVVPPASTDINTSILHPLGRYSASRDLHLLEKNMVEEKPLLGQIALLGQATVEFAQANTGKTLINLYLLIEAIKDGRVDPAKVFYINMDDNSSGLLIKCRLAQEYGFSMLADGHQGFQAKAFRAAMITMIESDSAKGVVVILDTLKKFVNTMDKVSSSGFAAVVRQFCLKGGTVIALAHTNKNPGQNGKPVYSGTTDIVDDFDCAYTLATVQHDPDLGRKLVEFENIKRRGNVALNVAYSYASGPETSYDELVLSVHEVDPLQLNPIKAAAEAQSDAKIIAAVVASIHEGVTTKMKLTDAVSKKLTVSKRDALKVIEKYTGTDVQNHRWKYAVGARGAQIFELLDLPPNARPGVPHDPAPDAPCAAPPETPQAPL